MGSGKVYRTAEEAEFIRRTEELLEKYKRIDRETKKQEEAQKE